MTYWGITGPPPITLHVGTQGRLMVPPPSTLYVGTQGRLTGTLLPPSMQAPKGSSQGPLQPSMRAPKGGSQGPLHPPCRHPREAHGAPSLHPPCGHPREHFKMETILYVKDQNFFTNCSLFLGFHILSLLFIPVLNEYLTKRASSNPSSLNFSSLGS